jgi:RHS repeat-associated protein
VVTDNGGTASGVGQYIFYNDSAYGDTVAPDKTGLLPGQTAAFANFTNYLQGLNGLDVDVSGLAQPTAIGTGSNDFAFAVSHDGVTWTAAPAPTAIVVHAGAGTGGSDRITITFADGAITNEWLRVTLKATARTGLTTPLVFYAGNLIGDATGNGIVTIADVNMVKAQQGIADILTSSDLNKNGIVTVADVNIAKAYSGYSIPMIVAPPGPAPIRQVYEWYAYDPDGSADNLIAIMDTNGNVTHRILQGPNAHEVLADEDTSKALTDPARVQWLLNDGQQSVRDVMGNDGSLLDHLTYDSFGNIVAQTNTSNAPRFQFTGMQKDEETGLLFDFRRYYDPKDGRFISQDPKGFGAGDQNLYRYVGNNPLNAVDPTGLEESGSGDDNGEGFSDGGAGGDVGASSGDQPVEQPVEQPQTDTRGSAGTSPEESGGLCGGACDGSSDPVRMELNSGAYPLKRYYARWGSLDAHGDAHSFEKAANYFWIDGKAYPAVYQTIQWDENGNWADGAEQQFNQNQEATKLNFGADDVVPLHVSWDEGSWTGAWPAAYPDNAATEYITKSESPTGRALEPGPVERFVPLWGSGKALGNDLYLGKPGRPFSMASTSGSTPSRLASRATSSPRRGSRGSGPTPPRWRCDRWRSRRQRKPRTNGRHRH